MRWIGWSHETADSKIHDHLDDISLIFASMMALRTLLVFVCAVLLIGRVDGLAQFMIGDHCGRSLDVGTEIMNIPVVASNDKTIAVTQNMIALESGAVVRSLEGIEVTISPKTSQGVLEVTGDGISFVGGYCGGNRIVGKSGALVASLASHEGQSVSVSIRGAWATSYNSGVKVTAPYYLSYQPIGQDL